MNSCARGSRSSFCRTSADDECSDGCRSPATPQGAGPLGSPPLVRLAPDDTAIELPHRERIRLTATQFRVFRYLVERPGQWVPTRELVSEALPTHHQPDTSLIRVYIHQIRSALGYLAANLETDRRGRLGYRWGQRPSLLSSAIAETRKTGEG